MAFHALVARPGLLRCVEVKACAHAKVPAVGLARRIGAARTGIGRHESQTQLGRQALGAGFYLDATEAPWEPHWRMESYITRELLPLLGQKLPIDLERIGLFGHSMGGHGALTLALRHPGMFKSLSAFAPIAAPTQCPWGQKAFSGYLGSDQSEWRKHDASVLMASQDTPPYPGGILIDQGLADKFLLDGQLLPEALEAACAKVGQPLTLRRQPGYDHGYYFIQTFMDDHLAHHAQALAD